MSTIQTMPPKAGYARRFDAVLAYIDANLEGDLSVEALSGVRIGMPGARPSSSPTSPLGHLR